MTSYKVYVLTCPLENIVRYVGITSTPSKETRQKMSEANSGSNHYNYGKSLGIEHKKALSVALTGRVFTEEHRQKQSLSGKQRPDIDECIRRIQCQALQQRKPIEQLTKQGQLIADFSSLTEASHQTGNDVSLISRVCNGKSKSAGGYLWRFKS